MDGWTDGALFPIHPSHQYFISGTYIHPSLRPSARPSDLSVVYSSQLSQPSQPSHVSVQRVRKSSSNSSSSSGRDYSRRERCHKQARLQAGSGQARQAGRQGGESEEFGGCSGGCSVGVRGPMPASDCRMMLAVLFGIGFLPFTSLHVLLLLTLISHPPQTSRSAAQPSAGSCLLCLLAGRAPPIPPISPRTNQSSSVQCFCSVQFCIPSSLAQPLRAPPRATTPSSWKERTSSRRNEGSTRCVALLCVL